MAAPPPFSDSKEDVRHVKWFHGMLFPHGMLHMGCFHPTFETALPVQMCAEGTQTVMRTRMVTALVDSFAFKSLSALVEELFLQVAGKSLFDRYCWFEWIVL